MLLPPCLLITAVQQPGTSSPPSRLKHSSAVSSGYAGPPSPTVPVLCHGPWQRTGRGQAEDMAEDMTVHVLCHVHDCSCPLPCPSCPLPWFTVRPTSKFIVEQEVDGPLPFLDTLLRRREDGSLDVSVYRKPTHTNWYLHFESHHP